MVALTASLPGHRPFTGRPSPPSQRERTPSGRGASFAHAPEAPGGRFRMIRHRLSLLCLGVVLATPATAQIMGRPIELSAQAGWNHYDTRARMQDGPGYGAT